MVTLATILALLRTLFCRDINLSINNSSSLHLNNSVKANSNLVVLRREQNRSIFYQYIESLFFASFEHDNYLQECYFFRSFVKNLNKLSKTLKQGKVLIIVSKILITYLFDQILKLLTSEVNWNQQNSLYLSSVLAMTVNFCRKSNFSQTSWQ